MLEYVTDYLDVAKLKSSSYMVEVGAHHWDRGSRSKEFIEAGWEVLLIEPHPRLYEELSQKYAGNNKVTVCGYAASDEAGLGILYEGARGPDDGCHTMFPLKDRYRGVGDIVEIQITKKTLTSIFEDYGVPSDLAVLCIDTEGMDWEVLRGLDFDRYKPIMINSEKVSFNSHLEELKGMNREFGQKNNLDTEAKNMRIQKLLVQNSYLLVGESDGIDNVYLLKK